MKYYTGLKVKNHKQILYKLRFNQKSYGYFLICLEMGPGLLAIMSTSQYIKYKKKNRKYKIIGIAKGKIEAHDIVLNIISDYYKDNNNFTNFKTDLEEKSKAW